MTKWEYAAIAIHCGGTINEYCVLVQPDMENTDEFADGYEWRNDPDARRSEFLGKILIRANDPLELVNKAGLKGWEMTGSPFHNSDIRMMRRRIE